MVGVLSLLHEPYCSIPVVVVIAPWGSMEDQWDSMEDQWGSMEDQWGSMEDQWGSIREDE